MLTREMEREIQELTVQNYRVVVPIFFTMCIMGVLANAIVIIALIITKVRTPTVTIISSLSFSDMWASSVVAASLLYNSYIPILYQDFEINPCISLTLELFRTGGLITGTLHLLLISIHHYIGITRPYYKRAYTTKTFIVCILIWILPSLFLVILASSFKNQGFRNCWEFDNFYHTRVFRVSVSTTIVIIFLIIIFCYARMIYLLRLKRRKWQSRSASNKTKNDNRTVHTTVLICSSFFIGWAPATIQFAITCGRCQLMRFETVQGYKFLFYFSCLQLTFLLGKTLMNPLIYSFRIPEVDRELRKMHNSIKTFFTRLTKREPTNPRKYNLKVNELNDGNASKILIKDIEPIEK
uniref:G_PROTEIN_RECEP_F1_2 domain-containing protein n=1 Tax=Parastrongyloides trichosuri TaxID=131310 RepID=A0A0N4ZBB1_PARTI